MPISQSILLISTTPEKYLKAQAQIDINQPQIDTMVINPDKSIGIDAIREGIRFSRGLPVMAPQKHLILLNAQSLTLEAQNACLKLLEEPPVYLTIYLVTSNPHLLLDTIQSRCQLVYDQVSPESPPTQDALSPLLIAPLPDRLNLLPAKSTQVSAIDYCQTLIASAHQQLRHNPSPNSGHNLQILLDCLTHLQLNTNPTLTLADTILRLK